MSGKGTDVLAEQAPELDRMLEQAHREDTSHLVLHGTVVPTDRCAEKTTSVKGERIDLRYSGKAHVHGANLQGLMVLRPGFCAGFDPRKNTEYGSTEEVQRLAS
ncbi:hypothetical protein GCM10023224_14090 [Streptomonospora halophila]|uniref:Uncharacterized protein n=1 Tax=Streptomonospora halophila TaxID=427369 RepID=A0ABP9GA00_9ACTN